MLYYVKIWFLLIFYCINTTSIEAYNYNKISFKIKLNQEPNFSATQRQDISQAVLLICSNSNHNQSFLYLIEQRGLALPYNYQYTPSVSYTLADWPLFICVYYNKNSYKIALIPHEMREIYQDSGPLNYNCELYKPHFLYPSGLENSNFLQNSVILKNHRVISCNVAPKINSNLNIILTLNPHNNQMEVRESA